MRIGDPLTLPRARATLGEMGRRGLRCALLSGGTEAEKHEVRETAHQILPELQRFRVDAAIVDLTSLFWPTELAEATPDVCLVIDPVCKPYCGADDVRVFLEEHGLVYTGPSLSQSEKTADKLRTKRIARDVGLQVPDAVWISELDEASEVPLLFPVVVKPRDQGGGRGVAFCADRPCLLRELVRALAEFGGAIVEQFIDGVEVAQPVFVVAETAYLLPTIELEVFGHVVFNAEAKHTAGSFRQHIPARIGGYVTDIAVASVDVAAEMRWTGLVRVDYLIERCSNRVWFLEANGHPALGNNEGLTVPAARSIGLLQADVVGWILAQPLGLM